MRTSLLEATFQVGRVAFFIVIGIYVYFQIKKRR